MRLSDRIALITAAGSGMGRAAAELFAAEGATVVVADLSETAAQETVASIESAGGSALAVQCDVSEVSALERLVALVKKRYGVLHVLYNHAGIPGAGGLEMTEAEFQQSIDVNLKSAFFGTSLAMPLLLKAGGTASIIYTASTSGLVGSPLSPLYSLTKGGVVLLMKGVALRYAKQGVRANAICPGPTATPMLAQFFGRGADAAQMEAEIPAFLETAVPMGRAAQPEEIAHAALWLASDESSYVTGVALPVDGGYTAR
jgi:NAD(P)-dependent dehydrogenase (short-subunit alcohol dehydrogenase family)